MGTGMTEFMVAVERAVRPVQAGPTKKLRMREELLAHLHGIYEQELARLGDDAAARAEALQRFGDPDALTAELQQSVKWSDRTDARLNRVFGWHPGESTVRYAARIAGLVAVLILFWMLFTLAATAVRRPHDSTVPTSAQLLRLFGALMVCASTVVFVLAVCTVGIRDALYGSPRSWRRVVGFAAVTLVAFPALGVLFYLTGLSNSGEMIEELTTVRSVLASAAGYVLVTLFVVWFAWKVGPAQLRYAEWALLDIGR